MKGNFSLLIVLLVLAVVAGVAYFVKDGGNRFSSLSLREFSLEDTAAVTRVFISDASGEKVNIERNSVTGQWMLNNTYPARKDAINLILKTLTRLRIKGTVAQDAKANVIKQIAGSGKRVEVYTGGDEPEKIYFIGSPTPDHYGTYMLLEIPGKGRSEEPFVMHMEGFSGFLSTRFFTNAAEWRHTGIFNYPSLDIRRIDVSYPEYPGASFSILYGGGNNLRLSNTSEQQDVAHFDTLLVKDYLLKFKKVHLETFNNHLSVEAQDSLRHTLPAVRFQVTDNAGQKKAIDLFWKSPVTKTYDDEGNVNPWDGDRMYGIFDNEVVLVQRYTFDPLMLPIAAFEKSND